MTDRLVSENRELKSQVAELNSRLNTIEQYSRSNNLEIQGVTKKNDENLDIVCSIAQHLDFNITESMIDPVHRVPTRKENGTKNIIVRFQNRRKKEVIMAAAKTKRLLGNGGSPGFQIDGVSKSLFINEHLTSTNKLYIEALSVAESREYGYETEISSLENLKNLKLFILIVRTLFPICNVFSFPEKSLHEE
ncbi:hypothetical protein HHI36_017307 [Cryptolaemus montrouzieri]|uniref:Uncharacterized protein n=1 Tax=Cryptolaemus montrouzieri TaxID=559131 RepID=A0ABD2NMP3_9CUCU